ncbi:Regulatory protein BlaR1 [compost metagenome]
MDMIESSLSVVVLIVAIIVVRTLTMHQLPKLTFLVLWGVAAVRLLLPMSLPFRFSFYTGIHSLQRIIGEQFDSATLPADGSTVSAGISPFDVVAVGKSSVIADSSMELATPLITVWLAGACLLSIYFIVTYIKCRREFQTSLPVTNSFAEDWMREHRLRRSVRIRQSDKITTPLTYGIWRPVILLPKAIDWVDETRLRYILTHEWVHIRRFDALTKPLLALVLCLHWFNPFVWAMFILANRDLELSCDEVVLRIHGVNVKSTYAMTLISMEERKSRSSLLFNHFGKNAIQERIVSIMKLKKLTFVGSLLALAVVIGTTTVFATNAAPLPSKDEKSLSSPSGLANSVNDDLPPYTLSEDRGEVNYPKYFTYDPKIDRYFYKGSRVVAFYDHNVWRGANYSSFSYDSDQSGDVVYIQTIRDSKTNEVIGMKEMTQEDANTIYLTRGL